MARKPQQERSKATMQAIVEAGFISLQTHGLGQTTTRHIADIAGVGVGSLYEYFPNKEAVFKAMNAHLTAEIVAMVRELMPSLVRLDIRPMVIRLLGHFRELLNRNDGRYLKYAGFTMQAERGRQLEAIQQLLVELIMQYALHNPQLTRLKNLPVMSYIFIHGSVFTIIRHLSEPNPNISFEQLSEGLAEMIASYAEAELAKLDAAPLS
ncbi:TetR/AcrR family transcriptional regulator [Nevskia ramosa]|uniref:TetR/AcrR family transcriptional regulator n=1 Tax=Nevskia ramosa TaxID=64002 RepID=UPI0003B68DA8|nr:TetR/AcrR family transcriptional regulator [Nevskia ramosa]